MPKPSSGSTAKLDSPRGESPTPIAKVIKQKAVLAKAAKAKVRVKSPGKSAAITPKKVKNGRTGGEIASSAAQQKTAAPSSGKSGKKPKLVRDSFTIPANEYELLAGLKKRCLSKGIAAKKSEVLRAAIAYLAAASDANLLRAIKRLEIIKTGRPKKGNV